MFHLAKRTMIRARATPALVPKVRSTMPLLAFKRSFISTADWEPVRAKEKPPSRTFIALLILMPIVSFGLGTWQVKRLQWKQELIANAETQLSRPPLDLPDKLNPEAVEDFDYRRVRLSGTWDHSREMLVGPRTQNGKDGYYVITPLVREGGSKVLINRGWIDRKHAAKSDRPDSLPTGKVTIYALLRKKPLRTRFSTDGRPEIGMYHFMDIDEMARRTGAQPIYIQQLMMPDDALLPEQKTLKGIPVGFTSKVEFRNTHFQYILTWYGLSAITLGMLIVMLRKGNDTARVNNALRSKLAHAKKWQ